MYNNWDSIEAICLATNGNNFKSRHNKREWAKLWVDALYYE